MNLIDTASNWIESKTASYLCKEDKVVWFASITGRNDDKEWQEMTLPQVQRVINFTLSKDEVSIKDIITAFQEIGEVYEMGVSSPYKTPDMIFNYTENSPIDKFEKLVRELSRVISKENIKGIQVSQLNFVWEQIAKSGNFHISNQLRNTYYRKYFGILDYVLREGTNRIFLNGKKLTVMMHKSALGKDIKLLERLYLKNLAAMVIAKLE